MTKIAKFFLQKFDQEIHRFESRIRQFDISAPERPRVLKFGIYFTLDHQYILRKEKKEKSNGRGFESWSGHVFYLCF